MAAKEETQQAAGGVAFCVEISEEQGEATTVQIPDRLLKRSQRRRRHLSTEMLLEKQAQAEQRRKAYHQDIIDRAQKTRQEVQELDSCVQKLLNPSGQDQPLKGQERQEAVQHVLQGFRNIFSQMNQDQWDMKNLAKTEEKNTADSKSSKCNTNRSDSDTQSYSAKQKDLKTEVKSECSGGMAFNVEIIMDKENTQNNVIKIPERLCKVPDRKQTITAEVIQDKQRRAEQRRKAHQDEKRKKARDARKEYGQLRDCVHKLMNPADGPTTNETRKERQEALSVVMSSLKKIGQNMDEDIRKAEAFMEAKPGDYHSQGLNPAHRPTRAKVLREYSNWKCVKGGSVAFEVDFDSIEVDPQPEPKRSNGVAFVVDISDSCKQTQSDDDSMLGACGGGTNVPVSSSPPERLLKQATRRKKTPSYKALQDKMKKAEQRRKAHNERRRQRAIESRIDAEQIDQCVQKLIAPVSMSDSGNIRPLTVEEKRDALLGAMRGFQKIGLEMEKALETAEDLRELQLHMSL